MAVARISKRGAVSETKANANYSEKWTLKWYYDQILPLDFFLSVSHRILWKNKNAVYRLQISALVREKWPIWPIMLGRK